MALNPRVGHLYHDHNISNEFTALDARETLRTREINAREAKHLEKYSFLIDRAKNTCIKHNNWEQRAMRKSLNDIRYKTPSLSKSLLCETDRNKTNFSFRVFGNGLDNGNPSKRNKIKTKVSSWSVYSQITEHHSWSESSPHSGRRKQRGSEFIYNNCGQISNSVSRAEILVRKAETITKALHKLYSRGLERKWRESNTTVLEILGKESKEELEKALFILRGTATGDTIEDILKERERVSKATNDRLKSSNSEGNETSSPDNTVNSQHVNEDIESVGRKSDESKDSVLRSKKSKSPASAENVLINIEDVLPRKVKGSTWDNVIGEQGSKSKKEQSQAESPEDLSHVFDKDATWTMSSVIANPSEQGVNDRSVKWTELLKAPELWKINPTKFSKVYQPRPVSLVTLAGKRRRTLLRY